MGTCTSPGYFNSVICYNGTTGAYQTTLSGGNLRSPYDLIFGPDGDIYVADYDNNRVVRYDSATGQCMGAFVAPNSGGLTYPSGLAFGPDGSLFVTSTFDGKIRRYDGSTGAFLDVFVSHEPNGLGRILFASGTPGTPEPGLAGWVVYLDENGNGRRDAGERSTTTDANGQYSFTNLGAGTYLVAEVRQSGWVQTAPGRPDVRGDRSPWPSDLQHRLRQRGKSRPGAERFADNCVETSPVCPCRQRVPI